MLYSVDRGVLHVLVTLALSILPDIRHPAVGFYRRQLGGVTRGGPHGFLVEFLQRKIGLLCPLTVLLQVDA